MRYSLADYILDIKPAAEDETLMKVFANDRGSLTIGGDGLSRPGNEVGSVTASHDDDLWTTQSYPTGGWVHNKNLSKVGKITVTLNQLSNKIETLKNLCKVWRENDCGGLTISLMGPSGNEIPTIFTAEDCYLVKEPDQAFGATAADQDWVFTCGKIDFN